MVTHLSTSGGIYWLLEDEANKRRGGCSQVDRHISRGLPGRRRRILRCVPHYLEAWYSPRMTCHHEAVNGGTHMALILFVWKTGDSSRWERCRMPCSSLVSPRYYLLQEESHKSKFLPYLLLIYLVWSGLSVSRLNCHFGQCKCRSLCECCGGIITFKLNIYSKYIGC